ncbi:MAG: histidinol-phosphate transaminase [Rhizobacter sp.]|nr:histidinol-phosphate transaminase [Burkholderiales bacterium]
MNSTEIIAATIRPEVRALKAYPVTPPWLGIKLELMEDAHLDAGPSTALMRKELAERIAASAFNRYPDPSAPALKAKLREKLGIKPQHDILIGTGSDEIITMLSQAILAGGGTVLSLEPSFIVFKNAALAVAGRYVGVSLNADFTLDLEATLAAIAREKPKLIWIVYPNNPTGNLYPDAAIEQIIRAAPGLVVIDEAYEAFAQRSWLPRIDEFPNVLIMRTLSKIGLAGVRLGYIIGAPEWIGEINKVRGPFNVGVLQQVAAEVLLDHYDELQRHATLMIEQRERLLVELAKLPGVTPFPSLANFVLARFSDAGAVFEALKSRGILVRNLSASHPLMANTLRISMGTTAQMDALIVALKEIIL